jgi:ABC transporter substrate binding protein (PQQ-dependent alcohol dehydrogenase system)
MAGNLAGRSRTSYYILKINMRLERLGRIIVRLLAALGLAVTAAAGAVAQDTAEIKIGYLRRAEQSPAISLLDVAAPDAGLAGAELAIADNNTTGRFLNQKFSLTDLKLQADGAPAAVQKLAQDGISLVVADLPANSLLQAAQEGGARGMLFFNAGEPADALREEDCRANVIHAAPTRSILADGLAQYLVWKQWLKWVLVAGSHPEDKLFADALKRAATRFGAKIVAEKVFEDKGGARQTDSGLAEIQLQIPLFTQGLPDYDVLLAADENAVFADYLPYRTKAARPVAGSAGLMPVSWAPSMEQWGAKQLQERFMKRFSRRMQPLDMQAWTAVRMIGEAVSRTKQADASHVRDYILSPAFELAAFKGQALTVRPWDQQLRQPVLLSDGRNVVSVSPQQGFLHPVSELDTLGYDKPETKCVLK